MRKIMVIVGIMFFIIPSIVIATPSVKWMTDTSSVYYNYPEYMNYVYGGGSNDRMDYALTGMPLCADIIDNGNGPAGLPILEVVIVNGMNHGNEETPDEYIKGSVHLLNGETGEIIWSVKDMGEIFSHSPYELGDVDEDGKLEILINSYDAIQVLEAESGEVKWKITHMTHRIDKHNLILRDPRDDKVYIYTSEMSGGKYYKRNPLNGDVIAESTFTTGGPCFGGSASADLNNDGELEIVESYGGIACYDLDCNLLWKVTDCGGTNGAAPVLADVNKDGYLDVIVVQASYTNGGLGIIDGKLSMQNNQQNGGSGVGVHMAGKWNLNAGVSAHNQPAVGDVDGDGDLEALIGWSNQRPHTLWDLETFTIQQSFENSNYDPPVFGNVNTNDGLEIVTGNWNYNLWFEWDGSEFTQYFYDNEMGSNPSLIADIDGDGLNEVLSAGSNMVQDSTYGWYGNNNDMVWSTSVLTCFDTEGVSLNEKQEVWNQLYNERRTGSEYPTYPSLSASSGDPPVQTQCWGCSNGNVISAMFTNIEGCGIGIAENYPYDYDPITCVQPDVPCWECEEGELVKHMFPYGTNCEDEGYKSEAPICIPTIPGFELVFVMFALVLIFYIKKRS